MISSGYDLVEIKNVNENSINYGKFQTGDVIYGIDGNEIDFVHDEYFNNLLTDNVQEYYSKYLGTTDELKNEYSFTSEGKTYYMDEQPINFNVKRDGDEIEITAYINVIYNDKGEYSGWSLYSTNTVNSTEFSIANYKYSFGESLVEAIPFTCKWAWKIIVMLGQLFTGQLSLTSLGGPVTTINTIASYTQTGGWTYLAVLLPLIAVNLAVFNLLPIPALDGFQMIFVLIEWIRKKPLKQTVINTINNVGLIVLLCFVILVDILQFV